MKHRILAIILLLIMGITVAGQANATTYTSPTVDCSIGPDWDSDENLGYGTTNNNLWVTWDSGSLYIGIQNWDFSPSDSGDIQIYIDTANGGATTSYNWDGTRTIANSGHGYEYFFGHEGGTNSPVFKHYDGSSWTDATFNGSSCIGYTGRTDSEISIPWSNLGSPSQITLLVYIKNDTDNTAAALAYWPNVTGNTATSFTKGYRFTNLGSGVSPNGAPTAVKLSSFSASGVAKGYGLWFGIVGVAAVLAAIGLLLRRNYEG